MILAVALAVAPVALAWGGGSGNGPGPNGTATQAHNVKYSLNGTVQAADTVRQHHHGTREAGQPPRRLQGRRDHHHRDDHDELYQRTVDEELVAITLADFKAGDRVQSVGTLDKTDLATPVFTADRVTLRPAVGAGANCGV